MKGAIEMKRILVMVALMVTLLSDNVAASQICVYHNGIQAAQSSVITVMSKINPSYYLASQTANSLTFQYMQSDFWSTCYVRLVFTFANRVDAAGTPYTMITLQPFMAYGGEEYKPCDDTDFDNIMTCACAINDGYYYYGFDSDTKKVKSVKANSPAYEAGLRAGDVIKTWDSGDGSGAHKRNSLILRRTPIFSRMKFVTDKGKVVDMVGEYVSPEVALQELMAS
jgi:hypothetical protein